MRKIKIFLSLLMVMLLSVGNVWAAEMAVDFESATSAYSDWTFTNFTTQQTNSNVTAHGGSYFGTTGGKTTGSLQTKNKVNPSSITFYYSKTSTNTTASYWKVQVSTDGSNWTEVSQKSAAASVTRGTWYTYEEDLSAYSDVYVRIYYDGTTAVRCLDDVVLTTSEGGGTPTCATPTFSPAAGSYEGTQNVTISSTAGATIYYTTDGSTPTTISSVYSTPIAVAADMTIKAYAVKAEYDDSEVATAAYTITEGPDVTINLLDEGWGFPTSKVVDETSYTNGDYTIKVAGTSGNGFRTYGTYFLLGQSGAYIELPAFTNPIEKIVVSGNSSGSGTVTWNVYQGDKAVSTAAAGCKNDAYTFNIAAADQKANIEHSIKVTSAANLQIKTIKIYFGETAAVDAPSINGTTPFVGSTSVTITATDADAIYYTTNGDAPTMSSTLYSAPFSLTNTATVKAIAVKGGVSSAVAEKTFTKVEALTTMQAIFDAATSTATPTYITFSNAWVVTGVSTNGKNVYITDGTKGMILYNGGGNMGLAVGNTLSGTVQRSLKLYNGAAELDGFTTDGLTKGTASVPAAQELDADGIGALSGVNTGALIKISGACTEESSKLYVAGVQLYNSLFAYTAPTAGNNYNITGVYVQYNSTKEILPRSAVDIDEIVDPDKVATPTFSPAGGEYDEAQSVTIACATEDATIYYTIDGTNPSTSSSAYSSAIAVSETTTIKAFAVKDGMIDSDIALATYTISAGGDPTPTVTFKYEDYKGEGTSSSGSEYTMVKTDIVSIGDTKFYGNNNQAHFYANGVTTITPATGITITQIVLTATAANYNGYQSNGTVTASTGSLSHEEAVVTWTGPSDAAFTISHDKQIRWTTIVVTYEAADPSAPALAVSPTAIDFGVVEQGESVSAQAVAVNFANLTGAVTYSGLSSPFTATGSISASGDEITISADASTIGEYEQTLTVTSVADGKSATVTVTMNVVPVVSGDVYTKLTGSIEEGDYVIYFEGKALKNTIASSRFEYEEVTPVNNKISDPDPSIVWSVSQSGEYWTIYNEAVSKYAGATGSNNQGALLDAAGDKALWSISGTGAFDITNKYQSDNSKNAYLRNNGTYGFACYAVGTGGSLVLYKADNSKAPAGLAWSTDAVIIAVGDAFTAPTLSNPNNIAANEIDITSSNTSLATVTAGVVSLVENATGEATITATFAGDDNYKAATVSYTITVSEAGDDLSGTWALVTDVEQLAAGKKVVIAYCGLEGNYLVAKTMGAQNTNNRAAVESSTKTATDYTSLTLGPGTKVFALVDAGDGKFAIKASNGNYLTSATSGTNNNLLEAADYSLDNAKWTISISNEVASIVAAAGNKTVMQYNSSNTLFSCYGSANQKPVRIYMLQEDTPVVPEPYYTRSITAGQFGTICLPNGGTIEGATIFEIAHTKKGKIFFDEISEATMVAGRPYIFYPNNGASELKVYYTDSENAAAGSYKGLYGSYVQSQLAQNGENYILYDNKYYLVDSEAYVGANRAYIKLGEVPTEEQVPAPGRRRVSMDVQGEQVATSIINAYYGDQPMKVMIDNQLYIIRAGQMFDMTGNKIK